VKRKILYIALGLLIIINLTAFVTLTYHRCYGRHDKCVHGEIKDRGMYLCQELSLSESQIKDMEVISKKFHLHADSISSVLNIKRAELINMLSESNPDMKNINSQLEKVNTLQADLQKYVIHYLLKKREKLTVEQRKKFFDILKERFNRQAKCENTTDFNFIESSCDSNCLQPTKCSNK